VNRFSTVTSASVGSLWKDYRVDYWHEGLVGLSWPLFASGDTLYVWTHLLITPFAHRKIPIV